ncbi:twin-arginine translocase TatA/TatE family subunit [Deinococcus oregonensis]|uniref:Sec-independent protein translocase protein TatA n=1 Tax=Deinococcus oregonensis TaxID=1805970 RepID=A0ABV6B018_9DEIO
MSLGPLEIILIVAVIALIFGARKLPELGKGLGQGIKSFKKEIHDPVAPAVTDVRSHTLDPVRTADGRIVETTVTEVERR